MASMSPGRGDRPMPSPSANRAPAAAAAPQSDAGAFSSGLLITLADAPPKSPGLGNASLPGASLPGGRAEARAPYAAPVHTDAAHPSDMLLLDMTGAASDWLGDPLHVSRASSAHSLAPVPEVPEPLSGTASLSSMRSIPRAGGEANATARGGLPQPRINRSGSYRSATGGAELSRPPSSTNGASLSFGPSPVTLARDSSAHSTHSVHSTHSAPSLPSLSPESGQTSVISIAKPPSTGAANSRVLALSRQASSESQGANTAGAAGQDSVEDIQLPLSVRDSMRGESMTATYGEHVPEYERRAPPPPQIKSEPATGVWRAFAYLSEHKLRVMQGAFVLVVVFLVVMLVLAITDVVPLFDVSSEVSSVSLVSVTFGSAAVASNVPFTANFSFADYDHGGVDATIDSACMYASPGADGASSSVVLCAAIPAVRLAPSMVVPGVLSVVNPSLFSKIVTDFAAKGWAGGRALSFKTSVTLRSVRFLKLRLKRMYSISVPWGSAPGKISPAQSDVLAALATSNASADTQSLDIQVARFGSDGAGVAFSLPANTFRVMADVLPLELREGELRREHQRAVHADEVASGSFVSIVLGKSSGYTVSIRATSTRGAHLTGMGRVASHLVSGSAAQLRVEMGAGSFDPSLDAAMVSLMTFPFRVCARLPSMLAFNGDCTADTSLWSSAAVGDLFGAVLLGTPVHRIQVVSDAAKASFNAAHGALADSSTLLAWVHYWGGPLAAARVPGSPFAIEFADNATGAAVMSLELHPSQARNVSLCAAWARLHVLDAGAFASSVAPAVLAGRNTQPLTMSVRVRIAYPGSLLQDVFDAATAAVEVVPATFAGLLGDVSLASLLVAHGRSEGAQDTLEAFSIAGLFANYGGDALAFASLPVAAVPPVTASVGCGAQESLPCAQLALNWSLARTISLSAASQSISAREPLSISSSLSLVRNATAPGSTRPDALDDLLSDVLMLRSSAVPVDLDVGSFALRYNHTLPSLARRPLVSAVRLALFKRDANTDEQPLRRNRRIASSPSMSVSLVNPLPFAVALLSLSVDVDVGNASTSAVCRMSGRGDFGSPSARPTLSSTVPLVVHVALASSVPECASVTSDQPLAASGVVHVASARDGGFDAWVRFDISDLLSIIN